MFSNQYIYIYIDYSWSNYTNSSTPMMFLEISCVICGKYLYYCIMVDRY